MANLLEVFQDHDFDNICQRQSHRRRFPFDIITLSFMHRFFLKAIAFFLYQLIGHSVRKCIKVK